MKLKLNKIVSYLIYSDLVFYTGWGLISPIFAIFILDSITGGNAFVVGMAAAVHLIVRSLLRVPFGMAADKSQKKSFYFMFFGLLIAAFVPLGYLISKTAFQIYTIQAVLGASLAMSTAGWTCIFSRHMEKGKESTEWGIDAVAVGLGPGIAGAVGGAAVTFIGFNAVFIAVSVLGLIGVILLLFIRKEILCSPLIRGKIFTKHEQRRIKKMRVYS